MYTSNIKHIKKTFTKQYSQFYCGLACLTSIVRYYGGMTSQEKLRHISGTSNQGTSLLGLYQSAKLLGFKAKGYEADIYNLKEIKIPVILHVIINKTLEHYVVCYGYQENKFLIGDPAVGINYYSEDQLTKLWQSNTLLYLEPGKDFKSQKAITKGKLKWFLEFIKEDIPVLLIAAFIGIIISILGLSVAIYSQKLIDTILPSQDKSLLIKSLVIFFLIILAKSFISYLREIFLIKQSKSLNFRIIASFFSKLLFLPISFFNSISTGDMIGRLNDSQRIQKVVINLSSNVIIDILIVITSLTYIYFLSITAGLISTISIPFFGIVALTFNKQVISQQKEVMKAYALTEGKYINTIQGIEVIKYKNKESFFSKSVLTVYNFFLDKIYQLGILSNKMNLIAQIGSTIIISTVIASCSFLVLSDKLLIGEMIAIISIIGSLLQSVINTAMANIQLQEAKVAFERMYEFSSTDPEYEFNRTIEDNKVQINSIELKNISFRFPGKSLLLENIYIKIDKCQFVTIFGEIGSGKSTLFSIILRYYNYESGKILINNEDWTYLTTNNWRNNIGYVSQHIKLFNGTILENICLEENPDVNQIIGFCNKLGFDKYINELPQGYATIINENNSNLSGGQQQIIAIARALYQSPQILLLDEATSAMDQKTEKFILNLINTLKKNMIIVLITHRTQLAKFSDNIFILENNQITDSGNHEYLTIKNKLYEQSCNEVIASF